MDCNFTGDWTNNNFVSGISYYIQIGQTTGGGISGDWSGFSLHPKLVSFNAAGTSSYKATGNLSNWIIPENCVQIYIKSNQFTDLPRGNFKNLNNSIGLYAFENLVNQEKLDGFLVDLLAYYQSVTPIKNQLYKLNGAGMGIPSAIGLAAKTQLETIFTNAGFTITINVNS